nr:hypothetical protein [Tanacetum cinerariifolium]
MMVLIKRQKTSEYEAYVSGESSSGQDNEKDQSPSTSAYVSGESSSGQDNEKDQSPSTSGNQEQVDDYDFWTDSYASDDDEIPTKQVS